jgi:hypothetical protein
VGSLDQPLPASKVIDPDSATYMYFDENISLWKDGKGNSTVAADWWTLPWSSTHDIRNY